MIGLKICRIRWKKTQNKGYYGIQGHRVTTNQKSICDLLVITSNWHPISYRFAVIATLFKFRTLRFWATLWGLRDNVRSSSLAHWKAHSGLRISVNWTFFARCYAFERKEIYYYYYSVCRHRGEEIWSVVRLVWHFVLTQYFSFHRCHKPFYYVINLIIPCCITSVLTFILRPSWSELSISVTECIMRFLHTPAFVCLCFVL